MNECVEPLISLGIPLAGVDEGGPAVATAAGIDTAVIFLIATGDGGAGRLEIDEDGRTGRWWWAGIAHGDGDGRGGFRIAGRITGDRREGVGAIRHGGSIPTGAVGIGRVFHAEVGALEPELHARDADIIAGAGTDRDRAGDGTRAGGRQCDCRSGRIRGWGASGYRNCCFCRRGTFISCRIKCCRNKSIGSPLTKSGDRC